MGFFRLKKRDRINDKLATIFSKIKADIESQRKWLDYLHNMHLNIRSSHELHKTSTSYELGNIKKWINYLYTNSKKQEKDFDNMQKQVVKLFESYNRHISKIYKKLEAIEARNKHISEKPAYSTRQELSSQAALTNPEQRLLNFLLNQPDPVSYESISSKTGHSINTIRVVMNSLKKKGLIEENLLPSGIKLFSAKNREKIKKIYNL